MIRTDSLGRQIILAGEVVLYLHDPRRLHCQPVRGSRFKVKFVRPPKGK